MDNTQDLELSKQQKANIIEILNRMVYTYQYYSITLGMDIKIKRHIIIAIEENLKLINLVNFNNIIIFTKNEDNRIDHIQIKIGVLTLNSTKKYKAF